MGDKLVIASSLNNIGSIYEKSGNSLLALDYFKRSLKIYEETGFKSGTAFTLNNVADLMFKKGDLDVTS